MNESVEKALEMLKRQMYVSFSKISLGINNKLGLVIVNQSKGFCPPYAPDRDIDFMVSETDNLAKRFCDREDQVFIFQDSHKKVEKPFSPRCMEDSAETELVEKLQWLKREPNVFLKTKNCANGFVGSILKNGENMFQDWVNMHGINQLIVTGTRTDICVMELVQATLSAIDHNLMPTLSDVIVYSKACTTYDQPMDTVMEFGLPVTSAHPKEIANHMGFYLMQRSGAIIAEEVNF